MYNTVDGLHLLGTSTVAYIGSNVAEPEPPEPDFISGAGADFLIFDFL